MIDKPTLQAPSAPSDDHVLEARRLVGSTGSIRPERIFSRKMTVQEASTIWGCPVSLKNKYQINYSSLLRLSIGQGFIFYFNDLFL